MATQQIVPVAVLAVAGAILLRKVTKRSSKSSKKESSETKTGATNQVPLPLKTSTTPQSPAAKSDVIGTEVVENKPATTSAMEVSSAAGKGGSATATESSPISSDATARIDTVGDSAASKAGNFGTIGATGTDATAPKPAKIAATTASPEETMKTGQETLSDLAPRTNSFKQFRDKLKQSIKRKSSSKLVE